MRTIGAFGNGRILPVAAIKVSRAEDGSRIIEGVKPFVDSHPNIPIARNDPEGRKMWKEMGEALPLSEADRNKLIAAQNRAISNREKTEEIVKGLNLRLPSYLSMVDRAGFRMIAAQGKIQIEGDEYKDNSSIFLIFFSKAGRKLHCAPILARVSRKGSGVFLSFKRFDVPKEEREVEEEAIPTPRKIIPRIQDRFKPPPAIVLPKGPIPFPVNESDILVKQETEEDRKARLQRMHDYKTKPRPTWMGRT